MSGADERVAATRAAVAALAPVNAREAASQVEVLAGLEQLARPFDEHAAATHVTGSALVVRREGIVLLKHKRLGVWLQPGGHVDGAEWPHEGAVREAIEETGLAVRHLFDEPRLIHVDAHDGGRGHRHLDLRYALTAPPDPPVPGPDESPECRWFAWEEASVMADPGLAGVLDRAADLVR